MTPNARPAWMEELEARLKEYYQVLPEAMGWVLLVVQDGQTNHCIRVHLAESLAFFYVPAGEGHADAQITLELPLLEKIFQHPEHFEPRSDFLAEHIAISGSEVLAHHFLQLLKRPGEYALQILKHVRAYTTIPQEVIEQHEFDLTTLLQAAAHNQPIVFRSILNWPICSWSLDEFESSVGNFPFRFNQKLGRMENFSDFAQELKQIQDEHVYTSGAILPAALEKYFPFPADFANITTPHQVLWFGKSRPGELLTKLHCDIFTSLLAQVWGKKKARLYPPQHTQYVYPIEAFSGYQPCMVNPLKPDPVHHAAFSKATCLTVEINPGDLLIIPSGWFHSLEADGLTFSISKGLPLEIAYDILKIPYN